MFSPRFIYCEQSLIPAYLERINDLGLGVEILFEDPVDLWPQIRWENLLDLADAVQDVGIPVSVHGPFHNLNLGSKDSHIRKYSREVLAHTLEVARAFRAPQMIFHSGFTVQYPPKARSRWLDAFSIELDHLLNRAMDVGVRMALENTYETDTILFE